MDDRSRFDGTTPCALGEEAVAFALHALQPDEEAAMRSHIERCRSCSETVRETELVAAAVGGAVEQVDPPPRLRANLLATAAGTPQSGTTPQPHPRFAARHNRSRTRARILIAAAAAAVVLAVGGLGAYTAQVQRQRDALAQALAGIVTQLDAPGSSHAILSTDSGQPVAAVLVTAEGRTVVTTGLDPNDSSANTYVVWGLGDGDPQPLAPFDVTSPGPGIHEIRSDDGAPFSAYAVSLEPGRTMPAVPTTVVASGEVHV